MACIFYQKIKTHSSHASHGTNNKKKNNRTSKEHAHKFKNNNNFAGFNLHTNCLM
jgi:hypothetical protein